MSNVNDKDLAKNDFYIAKQITTKITSIIAIAMSLFHFVTSAMGSLPTMQQRSVHVGFALMLIYLQSAIKKETNKFKYVTNMILVLFSLTCSIYILLNWYGLAMRVAFPMTTDLIIGAILIVLVIEGTRRKLGLALPIIASIFIIYGFVGAYLPPSIGHRGYSIARIVGQLTMATEGIYGTVVGVSATYIFLFVLFGALLEFSGAAKFFIDLSTAFFGKTKGGSAKVATVSSCLFGMVSGSAVANVMAVGPFTVPMMTRVGYTNRFSGAILSVAGTGGQFMPPIMGAAAFIISETLGVPYVNVALAALIPGFLYYAAIWFIIDLRSSKMGIKGLDPEDIPDWKEVVKNGFYLALPFIMLVVFLAILRWSPIKSGFWSIIAVVAVSWVKKETRMGFKEITNAFEKAAYGALDVAIVCATAGIIIGMLSLTGLGLKFSSLLVAIAGGNKVILLMLTAIAALVLGMGMTTTSVYIILSVLVAPALVNMGVPPLAAHLYVFYFGILSAITPPVATASFAAASVAKEEPFALGFAAWKIGLTGYILPFMFIFNEELLFVGSFLTILKAVVTSLIGIFALSTAIEGYFHGNLNILKRIVLFAAAILMIDSGLMTDLSGLILLAVVYVPKIIANKKSSLKEVI